MSTVVLRVSPRLRNLRTATTSWRRGYNFASTQYDAAFNRDGVPEAGAEFCNKLRADTIAYLDQFDPKTWTNDPVTTLLRGEALTGGVLEPTVDAFGCENGTVVQATPEQVEQVDAAGRAGTPITLSPSVSDGLVAQQLSQELAAFGDENAVAESLTEGETGRHDVDISDSEGKGGGERKTQVLHLLTVSDHCTSSLRHIHSVRTFSLLQTKKSQRFQALRW